MLAGTAAGALGALLLAITDGWLPATVVFGYCSLAMPAMTAVAMRSVGSHEAGVASGVLNAARQTGGALGVALLGGLLGSRGHQHVDVAMATVAGAFVVALALSVRSTAAAARRS